MGIDWYTKHMPIDFEWNELTKHVTAWKCYENGTFPEGHKSFDHIDHPSGAEVILTENISPPTEEYIKEHEMTQEDIDEWMEECGAYTYLSFRASSYPGLGEKVNLIMEYFLHAKDGELEEFVTKSLEDNPDAAKASKGGMDFFKSVLGDICQLGFDEIAVGGKVEDVDDLSNRISGAIYFRDLKWQECGVLAKLFERVSEYCTGYYVDYFKGASDFMRACFVNQVGVRSSY